MSDQVETKEIETKEESPALEILDINPALKPSAIETKKAKSDDPNSDIFITEEDVFDVTIQWYKKDNVLYVDKSETQFDSKADNIKSFTVTFKYPSQGDYESVLRNAKNTTSDLRMNELTLMELSRVFVLIRKWSLPYAIMEKINELDPSITKAILFSVREVIGMKGIF